MARPGAIFGPNASTPGGISLMPSSGSPRTLMTMAMSPITPPAAMRPLAKSDPGLTSLSA